MPINFVFGSRAKYDAIVEKNSSTLYFVDGLIYKGTVPYSNKVSVVDSYPQSPALGIIYVNSTDYSAKYYDGTNWVQIAIGRVTTIDGNSVTNDSLLVTQGAVKNYVESEIASATLTSVFTFKGTLTNKAEVDAVQNPAIGDVYHTSSDGKEYVYIGTDDGNRTDPWELLGFTIDLSTYATKTEVATAKSEAITAANAYTDSKIANDVMPSITWTDLDAEEEPETP